MLWSLFISGLSLITWKIAQEQARISTALYLSELLSTDAAGVDFLTATWPWPGWHWPGHLYSQNLPPCLAWGKQHSTQKPSFPTTASSLRWRRLNLRFQQAEQPNDSLWASYLWHEYIGSCMVFVFFLILLPYREDKIPDTNGNSAAGTCHNYSNYVVSYESVTVWA